MILNKVVQVFLSLLVWEGYHLRISFSSSTYLSGSQRQFWSLIFHVSHLPLWSTVAISFLISHQWEFSNILKGKRGMCCGGPSHPSTGNVTSHAMIATAATPPTTAPQSCAGLDSSSVSVKMILPEDSEPLFTAARTSNEERGCDWCPLRWPVFTAQQLHDSHQQKLPHQWG